MLKGGGGKSKAEPYTYCLFLLDGRENIVLWLAYAPAHYQPGFQRWDKGRNHVPCLFFQRLRRGGVTR